MMTINTCMISKYDIQTQDNIKILDSKRFKLAIKDLSTTTITQHLYIKSIIKNSPCGVFHFKKVRQFLRFNIQIVHKMSCHM